jgi:hypothetical protein
MAFCPQCGVSAPSGTRFCASCGAALGGPTGGPVGLPAAPREGPTAPAIPPDTELAENLLLVGAFLGAVLPLLFAGVVGALGALFAIVPFGAIPAALLWGFASIVILLSLVWSFAALYARRELQQGHREQGAMIALAAGVLMLVTGGVVSGLFVLLAGILAYTAK